MNYYEILGIRENSTIQEIKKAYKSLVKKYHPDVSADTSSTEDFLLIQQAYQILSDPNSREDYDSELQWTRQKACKTYQEPGTASSSLFEWLFHKQILRVGLAPIQTELTAEIVLTPEEARRGGMHTLSPTIQVPCPACYGLSRSASLWCSICYQTGTVRQQFRIPHRIPAGINDQAKEYFLLDRFGLPEITIEIVYTVCESF